MSIVPLLSYAAQYEKYRELIDLDVAQYLADFMSEEKDPTAVRNECLMHRKSKEAMEGEIPLSVDIGLFHVNTIAVRDLLLEKRRALSHALLDFLGKSLRSSADACCKEYNGILQRLYSAPNGIEELAETREYMKSVPDLVKQLSAKGTKCLSDWELLGDFQCNLSDEDSEVRWDTYGWPKKIQELLVTTSENMVKDEDRFRENLHTDMTEFTDRIVQLQKQVGGFFNYTDIDQSEGTAVQARKVTNDLKTAQEDAQKYNVQQRLFGEPVIDYDQLSKAARDFEPFKNLWITADEWKKSHAIWMTDSLMNLNPDLVEKQIADSWKAVLKSKKAFADIEGCRKVAETVEGWIAEFKPYGPLINALRNPGMRERHWEALSENLGFEVKPDKKLTFTKCLDMKLDQHIDAIVKVGETAGKEFGLETALDKMEADWVPEDLEIMEYKASGTYIMKASEECQQMLDDHIVMTQAMSFSPFKKHFEGRLATWEAKLRCTQ